MLDGLPFPECMEDLEMVARPLHQRIIVIAVLNA